MIKGPIKSTNFCNLLYLFKMNFHFINSESANSNQTNLESGTANLIVIHNLVPEVNRLIHKKWSKKEKLFLTTFVPHLPDLKRKYFRPKKQVSGQKTSNSVRYLGLKALILRSPLNLNTAEQSKLQTLLSGLAETITQNPGFQLGSEPIPARQRKQIKQKQ
jgi:hypothetical protein